jgi:Ca2+-binding RTX toxin-like protein
MPYNVTGTNGNDTLNQSGDAGPGTIVGLAGDDCIFQGTGSATITGDSGNDTVTLRTGNTGTINGGTENDSIVSANDVGAILLLGGDGADTLDPQFSTAAQTIVGGNDSSDGADSIQPGGGADLVFGNGGNDVVRVGVGFIGGGNDTIVAGFGNDLIATFNNGGTGAQLFFGNEGNDTVAAADGNDTAFLGLGNDSYFEFTGLAPAPVVFGNEGADTINMQIANPVTASTLVGGNDSADAGDSIVGAANADFIFGNGGDDSIHAGLDASANTVVGGFGSDCITALAGADLIFANESNDRVDAGAGANTVFGGLGNDNVVTGAGRDTLQGNEGNDTLQGDIAAGVSIDTIAGGSGNDVFAYADAGGDGNNAAGGGPLELINDVNWAEDKFDTATQVTFAANMGAGTGGDLNASANNAIAAAFALAGGGVNEVAAQFTFGGRTYVAINQDAAFNTFTDATDLLIDITGVTGTIATTNFI